VGNWEEDENKKLKDAVPAHGGKNWEEISALVQIEGRASVITDGIITTALVGKLIADEDQELKCGRLCSQ
jgi:hypothetical protein